MSAPADSPVHSEPAVEPPTHPFVLRNVRRNFTTLIVDPSLFVMGMAFFDPITVLPVLLERLGASKGLIGFTVAVVAFGWTLTALVGSHAIHGKACHRPHLIFWNLVSRVWLLALPLSIAAFAVGQPQLALWVVVGSLMLFGFGKGFTISSWYDIIAKTIPPKIRGRFFGVQATAVGLSSLLGSSLVLAILRTDRLSFPDNFVLITILGCLSIGLSMAALFWIREPAGCATEPDAPKTSMGDYVRQVFPLLRQNQELARLVGVRLLFEAGALAVPFYAIYSNKVLDQPLQMLGVYALTRSLGRVLSGPLWGALNDRRGASFALRMVGLAAPMPPLFALLSGVSPLLLIGTFALIGATEAGLHSSYNSKLLGSVDERTRPLALGVANIGLAPIALYGYLGGILLGVTSYGLVFALAATIAAAGFVLSTIWDRQTPDPVPT
jgi:predicted MFS family arabinose efflux permease